MAKSRKQSRVGIIKAGLIESGLAYLILIGIAAVIMLLFVGRWAESIQKEGEIKACQYSISLFTTATDYTIEQLNPKIKCPAPHEDIKGTQEEIQKEVAELIRTCWAKTNGKNNGLARTEGGKVRTLLSIDKGDSFCILCSSFTLDKPVPVQDLKGFMESQTMVSRPSQTYKEFLDTSWDAANLDKLFFNLKETGAIPIPGPNSELKGVVEPRMLDVGITYYITSYNKEQANTVVVAAQTDSANLLCNRYMQQRK